MGICHAKNLIIACNSITNCTRHESLDVTEIPENISVSDLPKFIPPITDGRVVKVYDGDTITIASRIPNMTTDTIYKFSVRLNSIDTAEINTKNAEEKQVAIQTRDALSEIIMGKYIKLQNVSLEKYGRLLADVYLPNYQGQRLHINKWLIENNYAVEYDGGTKKIPKSWKDYLDGKEQLI